MVVELAERKYELDLLDGDLRSLVLRLDDLELMHCVKTSTMVLVVVS